MFEDYTRQADKYTPALCARKYQELQQFKTSMLYHEPNEHDILMLRQQLAAGDRQLRYERSLRLRDQQRTQACAQKSADEAALFAQRSASLQLIINAHSQPEQAPPTLHSIKQPQQAHTVGLRGHANETMS